MLKSSVTHVPEHVLPMSQGASPGPGEGPGVGGREAFACRATRGLRIVRTGWLEARGICAADSQSATPPPHP